ncbi:hypothetical protein [Thioclava sp. GXIMD4216]|uniref:hypothetical protein n=1 Tax=Thioclava sp. GXIMD4216 TaxID=3131929 RepID=UPI0030D38AE6
MSKAAPQTNPLNNKANRALESFVRVIGTETAKEVKLDEERQKAFGASMTPFLETLDEETRAGIFQAIEAVATGPNRRKIASHPLRPNALIERLEAEAEKDAASRKSGDSDGGANEPA